MTRRIERAIKVLHGAILRTRTGKDGPISTPRQLGRGVPVQLMVHDNTVYLTQGDASNCLGDLNELKTDPEWVRNRLQDVKRDPLVSNPGEVYGELYGGGGICVGRTPMSYKQIASIVKVKLDDSLSLVRPDNADDYIKMLILEITSQLKTDDKEVSFPRDFIPEFIWSDYPGSGRKVKNTPTELKILATEVKNTLEQEKNTLPVPPVDIDEITEEFDSLKKTELEGLKGVLGNRLFTNLANKVTSPTNGGELEEYYNTISKLLKIRRDFKPLSYYEGLRTIDLDKGER